MHAFRTQYECPRFSYLTTFGDEPFLRKLCKKKALLKGPFYLYTILSSLRNKILSNRRKGAADCNTLKHWIFIQILIYIINKFFYCSPCTTSPFTRANGPSKQIPQYPKQPYSITSKFGSFSNFSKAACEPLARLPTQNSINGLIKILPCTTKQITF